jgi:hypothetical protein
MIAQFDTKNFLVLRPDGIYTCNTVWGWTKHDDGNTTYTFVAPLPRKEVGKSYSHYEVEGLCATPSLDQIILETFDAKLWRLPFGGYEELPYTYSNWLADGEQAV